MVFSFVALSAGIAQGTCQIYGPASACAGSAVFFSSDCPGNTFSWAIDNQVLGSGTMFEHTFLQPGTYLVTVYYGMLEEPGVPVQLEMQPQQVPLPSSGQAEMYITVLTSPPNPIIQASTTEICNSGSVTLSVSNTFPGITYTWHSIPSGYSGTGTSQTFTNVSASRQFYATANYGSCQSQSSIPVNVITTEVSPVLEATIGYRKRTIRGTSFRYDHFWQRSPTGTEITRPVTGEYAVTEEGEYYINRRSTLGNCWTTATGPIHVTVGLAPPMPVVLQVKKAGYNEIIFTVNDKEHVLTHADYYWVKDNTSNPEIISGYIVDNETLQGKVYQNGTYYLKGRDRITGTWGNTLTLSNVTLRDDNGLNWIHTKAFDGSADAVPVSESRSYFDDAGKPMQSQAKSFESGHVFASQNVKDKYDRVVGSTLSAPIQGQDFRYNADFFLDGSGRPYSPDNFDTPETKYNPDAAGTATPGTVGWYYSDQNTLEPNVGKTNYPYSRTEFYEDGTGEAKRAGSPGDYHRLGMGHEPLTGTFPVFAELNDYYARRSVAMGISPGQLSKGIQTVSRDENGRYAVSITDKEGKTVLTARAGKAAPGEHMLRIDNEVTASANPASPEYRKMLYFYILESQPVTITMSEVGSNTLYHSNIVKEEYTPTQNNYVASEEIRLLPGFSVTAGETLHGRIEAPSTGWSVENLVTGERLPVYGTFADENGNWPAGFYRIIVHSGEVTVSYTNYFQDVSCQFYDDMGRLKTSVSPNGYKKWIEDPNPAANFPIIDKTTYSYNFRGWLLSMTEPDAGTTTYKYRRDGKIRFSQNAQQALSQRFSYTHYDDLGRPVESGEYKGTAHAYSSLSSQLEYQDQVLFPVSDVNDWVKTYYDAPDANLPVADYSQRFVRGSVSYTENADIKTWYSYDELGRVTWMAQKPNALNRAFVSVYQYDFLGNVLQAGSLSYEGSALMESFHHHYVYDKDKRLSQVFTSVDGTNKTLRATYEYYLHGPLKRIELGNGVQGIDYVYNIHGWLTQINHPSLDPANDPGNDGANGFRKDAFGMTLDYYESEMEGLFPTAVISKPRTPEQFHQLPGETDIKQEEDRLAFVPKLVMPRSQEDWKSFYKEPDPIVALHEQHEPEIATDSEADNEAYLVKLYEAEHADALPAPAFSIADETLVASVNNYPVPAPAGVVDDALELAVLKQLYDSLGGINWTNKSGWPTPGNWPASATATEMDTWMGIVVTNGDITAFSLAANNLVGKIPAAISQLTALRSVSFQNNSIAGKIPEAIGSIVNLQTLDLRNNQLTGGIPSQLGNATALKSLRLTSNPLGGSIPTSLESLSNLELLELNSCGLNGSIPASLKNLNMLVTLNVSGNAGITGTLPPLGKLTQLQTLNLSALPGLNPGVIPVWIDSLTNLVSLNLDNSKRNGAIPASLGNLASLKTLSMAANQLTGSIPAELGNLSNLESLYLQSNQLTGSLPVEMGGMIKLKLLRASSNQLSGTLPPSLYTLTELTNLQLYSNQLTGAISWEIGNLTKLATLDISSNNFTGNIPASIGNLTLMLNFIVGGNAFTGTVPAGITNLTKLKLLYLYNNQLTGQLPELSALADLENIWVHGNQLEGEVGPWIGALTKLKNFRIDSNKFTSLDPAILQLPLLTNVYLTNNLLTAIPNFHTYSNKANLNLYAAGNYLDFGALEPLFGTGTHGIKTFTYSPQNKPVFPAKVHIPAGEVFELAAGAAGSYSTIIWEKQNGAAWVNVNALNENTTQQSYKITSATAAINGVYRWRMTSTRVTGIALESTPVEITAVDALPNQPGSGALFNGIISSVRWQTEAPPDGPSDEQNNGSITGMYRYAYDDKYQVAEANWAEPNYVLNTFADSNNKYRVTNLAYDPNGNIQSLTRYDKDALRTNNFIYAYLPDKNQLTDVAGHTGTGASGHGYAYNEIGQMVHEDQLEGEENDKYVVYDVSGKVKTVYTPTPAGAPPADPGEDSERLDLPVGYSRAVEYRYDDRGFRLAKVNRRTNRTTWYIRDASGNIISIYEQDGRPALSNANPVTKTEVPVYGSGKLGTYYPAQDGSMNYELTDHLGNVRALVRENVNIYTATMEDDGSADITNPRVEEMQYFTNLFETEKEDARFNHTPAPGAEYSAYLYWVGGSGSEHKAVGPAITLKVNAGDTIKAETWVRYENKVSYSRNMNIAALAGLLAGNFSFTQAFETYTLSQTTNTFSNALTSAGFMGDGADTETPFAYINYILFDENMIQTDAGWRRVDESMGFDAGQEALIFHQHKQLALAEPVHVPENGYIYIWVSNESEGTKVWYDDLKITHTQVVVTQASDYGVWGDVLRELKSPEFTYRHGYQGQFSEKDEETGWNHFELREYDAVIGRWTSKDPYGQYWSPYVGMGNDPNGKVDPTGGVDKYKVWDDGSVTLWQETKDKFHSFYDAEDGNLVFTTSLKVNEELGLFADLNNKTAIDKFIQISQDVSTALWKKASLYNGMRLRAVEVGWDFTVIEQMRTDVWYHEASRGMELIKEALIPSYGAPPDPSIIEKSYSFVTNGRHLNSDVSNGWSNFKSYWKTTWNNVSNEIYKGYAKIKNPSFYRD